MKILIAHNSYRERGGEDELVLSEKKLLGDFGNEIVMYERSNAEIDSFSLITKIRLLARDFRWSKESYDRVRSLVKKEKPDIAHIYNLFYLIGPSIYDALNDERIPVVQSLYNYRFFCLNGLLFRDNKICEDCLGRNFSSGIFHRCNRGSFLTSFFLSSMLKYHFRKKTFQKKVDAFIISSEFGKRKVSEAGLPSEKIFVKPHFIEPGDGRRQPHEDYALFVGRLAEYKGISTLIKAFIRLKSYNLKIVGVGPLYEQLKQQLKNCGNIELMGHVTDKELSRLLKKAAFLVCPSECYDNTPRVIVESFACGVPVIAGDIGSMRELVEDGRTGLLFSPGNSSELADKIQRLINDKNLVFTMGRNALERYQRSHSRQASYNKLTEIYESVIKNYPKRSA